MFVILSINLSDLTLSCWAVSSLWMRFYNNATKSSGNNKKSCRRFVFYGL